MLKYRLISFPLLIALGALIFCWKEGGVYIYNIIAPLALGLAVYETAAMLKNINVLTFPKVTGVIAALAALGVLNHQVLLDQLSLTQKIDMLFCAPAALLVLPALALAWRKEGSFEKLLGSAGVLLGFGLPLLAAVCCWMLTLPFELVSIFKGTQISGMLFLIAVSKSMDTGGYIFGMLTGKYLPGGNHKIAPAISPKKSWEGFAGGMLLAVLAACCFHWWGGLKLNWCIVTGVVLAVGSFFGDLTESALKRRCGIKDSGNYIPGMGGALDILDSFIYNGVLLIIMACVFYSKF